MNEKVLILTDALFLGKGKHKAAYIHPEDETKCVKVPFELPDTDIDRELEYREHLRKKHRRPTMLTEYYGTIETNKGLGYVYERVCDYDGRTSKALKELFTNPGMAEEHLGVSNVEVLRKFREVWMKEYIVTSDTDFVNYFAQKLSPTEFAIRIIDNVGTPAHFPLAYIFDYFAKKRAAKYWKRIVDRYLKDHATEKEKEQVKKLF